MTTHNHHCRELLEAIEAGNGRSQRVLAAQLGIALGLTNLLLKQMLADGWIEVVPVKPNRVHYEITAMGIREKARLSHDYLAFSAQFYASARDRLREVLDAVAARWTGPNPCRVVFFGAGEIAEIGFVCLQATHLSLVGVIDETREAPFFSLPVQRPAALSGQSLAGVAFDRLIVMALDGLSGVEQSLTAAALPAESVFWLRDWRWSNSHVAHLQTIANSGHRMPVEAVALTSARQQTSRPRARVAR